MTVWETDDEFAADATRSLPSPSNSTTSNRIPTHNAPLSSFQKPDQKGTKYSDNYSSNDGVSPVFDPHEITSTIHANLVSEILNLRRTHEAKKKEIESLELTLYETKKEQDVFSAELSVISKENFSLKRKLELIELETTSAISEITKERDIAHEVASDVKRRLELVQKKNRAQDDEIDRTNTLWARDKATWDEDKRRMERRIHVAENRLKKVLEEVMAHEANQTTSQQYHKHVDHEQRLSTKEESDDESVATRSRPNSVRSSMLSGLMGLSHCETKGLSLAEELDLDEIVDGDDEDESTTSKNHEIPRPQSPSPSSQFDNCGNTSKEMSDQAVQTITQINKVAERGTQSNFSELEEATHANMTWNVMVPEYMDTGIQYSQPSSPRIHLSRINDVRLPPIKIQRSDRVLKRMKSWPTFTREPLEFQTETTKKYSHSNSSNLILSFNPGPQTIFTSYDKADLSNPSISPLTEDLQESITDMISTGKIEAMQSVSTQTNQPPPSLARKSPPHPILIPSIQLFPPLSSAKSSAEHCLSPNLRDVGCQAVIKLASAMQSVAVQTENTAANEKLRIWTSQFQSSAISSSLPSPALDIHRSPSIIVRKSQSNGNLVKSRPLKYSPIKQTLDEVQPHPLDPSKTPKKQSTNKPLEKNIGGCVPFHINTSFSDGDVSSDENMGTEMTNYSGFHTPLSVPKARKNPLNEEEMSDFHEDSPMTSIKSKEELVPVDNHVQNRPEISSNEHLGKEKPRSKTSFDTQYQSDIHNLQDQHTSSPASPIEPPFPIPTRNSSRRPYLSPLTPDNMENSALSLKGSRSLEGRSLHKVRSATTLSLTGRNFSSGSVYAGSPQPTTRSIESSPPRTSPSIESLPNSDMPAVLNNQIPSMTERSMNYSHHRTKSNNSDSIRINSISSSRASVVSAIAEAMIGEWFYKYTRYRSRGRHDIGLDIDNPSGSRHRRWIWVAPYEREVLWSSRQPTSDSALMGKGGRKLIIQSVLDVKDDNPLPKNIYLYHRSILIFTPVRALKITATSAERHQTWMIALRFLAHSKRMTLSYPLMEVDSTDVKSQSHSSRRHVSIRGIKSKHNTPPRPGNASSKFSQHTTDNSSSFPAEFSNASEDISPAADAPIVPRISHRSVTNFTNSLTINYLVPNCVQRATSLSCHDSNPRNNRTHSRQAGYDCSVASALAAASSLGLSVAASENSDIYAYNSCPIIPTKVRTNYTNPCPIFPIGQGKIEKNNSVDNVESSLDYNQFDKAGTVCMQAFVNPRSSLDAYEEYESRRSSLVDDELDQGELNRWYSNGNEQAKKKWHGHHDKNAYMCYDETKIITERSLEDRCAFPCEDEVDLFRDF